MEWALNILITGASGFIGFHLSKKLAENKKNKIYLTDNHFRGKNDKYFKELINKINVFYIKADLSKKKDFAKFPKKIDLIFHLAAINGTDNFYKIPDQVLTKNTLININLFEHIKNKNIKIIFASSSEVYASTTKLLKNRIPSNENIEISIDDISNVRYSYAISKIFGESLLFSIAKNFKFPFVIVRFHNIYGPRMGNNHVIPELIYRIQKSKKNLSLYGSINTRSFCYVEDAINALIIVSKKINNEIIHIGNDKEEIKILNLSKKILAIMNKNLKIINQPAPAGSVLRRLPNIKKLKSLGYKPIYNLNYGLRETIKWYVKNKK